MSITILSVMHVNVNCSDLRSSLAFYQEVVGLVAESHTHPVPQDGAGFGMSGQVQWDAHILHDARGFGGPGVDLLEWKQPPPVGRPNPQPNALGFRRVGLQAPDLDAVLRRSGDTHCFEPLDLLVEPESGHAERGLWLRDPDGTTIELIERTQLGGVRLSHVTLGCSDLVRSGEWFEEVLGMELGPGRAAGAAAAAALGLEQEPDWEARLLRLPGQDGFAIDLVEWRRPAATRAPLARANHLGIYRMAFMVEDIRACHAELLAQGVDCPDPVFLDMGPEIPVEGVWAVFFPDPDGACLELIETPKIVGPTP